MVEDERGVGVLARQDQRIGQLVRVRPHVEAQIALREGGEATQERRIRVQVCGRVPVHDAGVVAVCGHTTNPANERARGQVGVQQCTECRLRRVGVDDDGTQRRCAAEAEREPGDPAGLLGRAQGILCVPTGFDVHHGSDAGRGAVGAVVRGQVGGEHVLRIADEVADRAREHSPQRRCEYRCAAQDLGGRRGHPRRGVGVPLVDVGIDDRYRGVRHPTTVRAASVVRRESAESGCSARAGTLES